MNILKVLKRSSLGLDLYLWLTYRTFTLHAPLRLSWSRLYHQFGVNPANGGNRVTVDNFRKDCLRELIKIKTAWPDLNYAAAQGVLVVSPSLARDCTASGSFNSWRSPSRPRKRSPGGFRKPKRPPFLWYPRRSHFWGLLRAFSTKPL